MRSFIIDLQSEIRKATAVHDQNMICSDQNQPRPQPFLSAFKICSDCKCDFPFLIFSPVLIRTLSPVIYVIIVLIVNTCWGLRGFVHYSLCCAAVWCAAHAWCLVAFCWNLVAHVNVFSERLLTRTRKMTFRKHPTKSDADLMLQV